MSPTPTGLPGKSGVSGGIVTIAPGKGGVGTWSPPLDTAGNSVRGQALTHRLSEDLGLNLFASEGLPDALSARARRVAGGAPPDQAAKRSSRRRGRSLRSRTGLGQGAGLTDV